MDSHHKKITITKEKGVVSLSVFRNINKIWTKEIHVLKYNIDFQWSVIFNDKGIIIKIHTFCKKSGKIFLHFSSLLKH